MRLTLAQLGARAARGERIAMVTCYDHASATIVSRAGLRFLLVGDSLGQVMLGHPDTTRVTLDDMVRHTASVVRGAPEALVVADLPFLTYASAEDAVAACRRLVGEAGATAVKLEGGRAVAPVIRRLVDLGVPVMGHVGFTPQSTHQIGVRVQGRTADAAAHVLREARAVADAGAFAMVLELVPAELAAAITARVGVPTIGIGAGAGCSGQVQVWHDVLGLLPGPAFRHARRYAEVGDAIEAALRAYGADVEGGTFPAAANAAAIDADTLAAALAAAGEG